MTPDMLKTGFFSVELFKFLSMLRRFKPIFVILFLATALSCGRDDPFGLDRDFIIEPEFQEYVDKFFEEAELRGMSIPRNNLEVLFVDELPGDFCGYGYSSFGFTQNARVEILNAEGCWETRTPLEKENFMFHELGHALLSRPHLITRFENEYPASLMCSSEEEGRFLGCNNYQTYYQTEEMRSYYLDELFNGLNLTDEPIWTMRNEFARELFADSIGTDIDSWETFGDQESAEHFLSSSIITGNSNALTISLKENTTEEVSTGWLQRFEISDFQDCSSIKARARVRTNSSFSSAFRIGLSLRERQEDGELNRFMFHRVEEKNRSSINSSEWMELEIYCVPDRSEVVTISFTLSGSSQDTIYVDDVQVELWN